MKAENPASRERLVVLPNVMAALTRVAAVAIGAHKIRVAVMDPCRTVAFPRARLPAAALDPGTHPLAFANACREAAERHGRPCPALVLGY